MYKLVPLTLQEANAFVAKYHRHHKPVYRDKFRVGLSLNNELIGVVQVGRPVNRHLDDGFSLEVVRLCTMGNSNACSVLYSAAARASKELGYRRLYTYILKDEAGCSLRASSFIFDGYTHSLSWNCPSRPRDEAGIQCIKQRWVRFL